MATRKRPRSSSSECELAWSWGRLGLFEPSIAAKIGSLPLGGTPSLADRLHRHAHRVRGLMTGHARARRWRRSPRRRDGPLVSMGPSAFSTPSRPSPLANTSSRGSVDAAPRLDPRGVRAARAERRRIASARRGMPPRRSQRGRASERELACAGYFSAGLTAASAGCTRAALRVRALREAHLFGHWFDLEPRRSALYIREHRRIHGRSLVTLQDRHVRVGAGVVRDQLLPSRSIWPACGRPRGATTKSCRCAATPGWKSASTSASR